MTQHSHEVARKAGTVDTTANQIDSPTDWKEHEHQSTALNVSAVKLLNEAGTLGLAIQALETAERLLNDADAYELALAKGCGHESYSELVAASKAVGNEDDAPWYLTELPDGRWLAWNKKSLHHARDFESQDSAEHYAKRRIARPKAKSVS